ncbi:hypothetical protein Bca4012_064400 [Brassica carinata]
MCKCRSHGTFPLRLQSSHLSICYYHQDLHRRPLRRLAPRFCSDRRALLLIEAWLLPRRPGIGRALQRHPFSGLVDSADGSISLSPLYPSQTNDLHVSIAAGLHQSFLWLRPPGIVHHLSVPTGMLTLEPFSEDQGRSVVHREDPTNQLPYALRVYSPADSHTCQTPWSVFQDGSNGEPTGRRPEHADAEARREARAADHD